MENPIHVLLFSGLFTQSISFEYVLIQQQKTWDEAQDYCRQNHIGNLVTVKSIEDWENVQRAVQPALTSAVWTGLYNDISSWRWSYQDEYLTFSTWYPEEPNNKDGKQECGFMYNEKFNDMSCNKTYPFFCYNEQQTGADRFVIYHFNMTWHQAQSYCRQHHTDLATIRNQAEKNQLVQMMGGDYHIWIGLYRDSWKSLNGKNVIPSSITWKTGQPDMTGPNRPCGAADPDGQINDLPCSDALPFICEICKFHGYSFAAPLTLQTYRHCDEKNSRKQIVRVEVKSGKNLNDPVVMETILQFIKEKARDHGIDEETRLTWKVQSNGNVFSVKRDQNDDAQKKTCEGM